MTSYSGQEIDLRECVQYVIDVLNIGELDAGRVDIRFADDIKRSVKKVHPGVGDSFAIRRREYNREEAYEPFSRDALKEVSSVVLGEFISSAAKKGWKIGTIRLYPNAIAEFCTANGLDPDTVLLATLAREAFQACHYSVFKSCGVSMRWNSGSTQKNRDIVKESLADAFEYIFLINQGGEWLNLAEAHKYMDFLENTWRSCDIEDWPTSGALGIGGAGLTKVATPPDIMDRLLHLFLYDWKSAADIIRAGYYLADDEICSVLGLDLEA
ncbi:MAG: hypothetical protein J5535_05935 [Firmicutes bacterium]|nr:hypothetical protein [Bacillota bacterium]